MIETAVYIYNSVADLFMFIVIINAILSWLIAFDVVNIRNANISGIVRALNSASAPIMRPIQRVIPTLGGVDISPIILFILINASYILLKNLFGFVPHGFFG